MKPPSISQTIARALAAAGLDPRTGPLAVVSRSIDAALAGAGLLPRRQHGAGAALRDEPANPLFGRRRPAARARATPPGPAGAPGAFTEHTIARPQGSRRYKLYTPSGDRGAPLPLIVMLHGCKQNPDDFAVGTGMNAIAEREGFLVAYPAQTARENGANCWNWFEPEQQARAGEEPALIAAIVAAIAEGHAVDTSRVFVAGLSAGAAMAVILGATHPELFAGVAAHSGLPLGAAHDVASAFAAMHGRRVAPAMAGGAPVRTIVLHGDADATVAPANGQAILTRAVEAFSAAGAPLRRVAAPPTAAARLAHTRADFVDGAGRHQVEEWVVHAGAHTWFGGHAQGSYTEAGGPNASEEIVRFFLDDRPARPPVDSDPGRLPDTRLEQRRPRAG